MDITPFLDLRIAPFAVFDALAERKTRVRFMVATATGGELYIISLPMIAEIEAEVKSGRRTARAA